MLPCAISDGVSFIGKPYVIIAFNTESDEFARMNPDIDRETLLCANFYEAGSEPDAEISRIIDRVFDLLYVKYGIVPTSFSSGRFSLGNGIARYSGRRLYLTQSELITAFYLALYRGRWVSAHEIAEYCIDGGESAVAVHICRINRKAKLVSPVHMIKARRGSGYTLT